ncbi:MAG: hypothetical protein KJ050_10610 [Candidatus Omnitrophica bacterium]|nr:hypothetical protein [Candidatus Omnitrophota bacterium]
MATTWKQFVNNGGSTLVAQLSNSETSFSVAAHEGDMFPSSGPFWVTVFGTTVAEGHEIILVGSRSGDTFSSCTRGQQDTSAAQWPSGSNVQLLWTAGGVTQIQNSISGLETGATLTDLAYTADLKIREAGTSAIPEAKFQHSRGSVASPSQTTSGDVSGLITFEAYAPSGFVSLAGIKASPDGQAPNNADAPGKIEFQTSADGTATPASALVLRADKTLQAGTTPVTLTDTAGYIQTAAIKTGTSNNGKALMAGGTEGSATWTSPLPSQTSNNGKFLTTDGSTASWDYVPSSLPDQSGNSGKFLTTNGTSASWETVAGGSPGADSIGATELKEDDTGIRFAALALQQATTGDGNPLSLKTSRGTLASPTNSGSGDGLGIDWHMYYSSAFRKCAELKAEVDGTIGSGDYPARMEFRVCKDGSASLPTDATMIIGNSQHVAIGDTDLSAAWLTVKGPSATDKPVLRLEQLDTDEPFIQFTGTSAADSTKSLSTDAIGTYTGRIRIMINNTDYWIPYYTP